MRGLNGRRVILTGGASGIGRAAALRLAHEGCVLGIFDLNEAGAQETVAHCAGGRARAYPVDITDRDQIAAAVASFEAAWGPVQAMANIAGWDTPHAFLDTDRALWDKVVQINLYGPLNMHHVVVRGMAERGFGRVVNVASDAGRVGSSGEAVYAACKGGIIAFTKTLARELARRGVTLNVVCPGPTDTPLFDNFRTASPSIGDALARAIPLRRIGEPDDYAGMIAFLLSDDAAYMTGQTISVSGGLTMVRHCSCCHPRESGDPGATALCLQFWISACAGMAVRSGDLRLAASPYRCARQASVSRCADGVARRRTRSAGRRP
jgi:2-hydroxycyclohexanecarboxyl-CoA dehydrogenase